MKKYNKKSDGIMAYSNHQEFVANTYVMRCFTVTMIVYLIAFLLNVTGIFIIEQSLMMRAFIPSLSIYVIGQLVARKMSLSDKRTKYFILFCTITIFTITGVFLTYHAILLLALPFLYATLYSSKRVMRYVFILTVIPYIAVTFLGFVTPIWYS